LIVVSLKLAAQTMELLRAEREGRSE